MEEEGRRTREEGGQGRREVGGQGRRQEGGGGRTRVRVRLGFISAVELRTMCRMLAVFPAAG